MILTTLQVKKLKAGTQVALARDHDPTQRVAGAVVQSGHKKVFVSSGGSAYQIKDRPGWHWQMEAGADSRQLPKDHARSGGDRHGQK